jgi:serine/threonine protein phosphatase 1
MPIHKLKINDNKRLFFVGDIHGHFDVFNYALKSLGFNENDAIVSVGDLIDRGEQNIEVLSFFLHTKNAYGVIGNHEEMAIKGLLYGMGSEKNMWLTNGGNWQKKYNEEFIKGILYSLSKKFPYCLEIEHQGKFFGVCHAEFPHDDWNTELTKKDLKKLVWNRNEVRNTHSNRIVKNIDYLIHGHTIFKRPNVIGNQHWIDTGVYRDCGYGSGGIEGDYALTIAEYKNNSFIYHRFQIDHYAPSRFNHI